MIHKLTSFKGYKHEFVSLEFGTGDINIVGLNYHNNSGYVALGFISIVDENLEIGKKIEILDNFGEKVEVFMTFSKVESIDVLMDALQRIRKGLIEGLEDNK